MGKCLMGLMVAAMLAVAPAAVADMIVLQNTAADQGIVDDSLLSKRGIDDMRNFGGGGNDGADRDDLGFYRGLMSSERASLLRFNNIAAALPASVVADTSKITRVTLALYQEDVGYASNTQNDGCSFYRLKRDWDEGTRVYGDIGSTVNGVTSRTRVPGTQNPGGWARTGGTNFVWELAVGSTIAEVGYNTNNQWGRLAEQGSIANVEAGTNRWYYDAGAGTLYVNKNNDGAVAPNLSSQGICYYTDVQAWQAGNASGDNDCDKVNAIDIPSDYNEWEIFGVYNQNYDPAPNVDKWVYVISDRSAGEEQLLDWVRGWVDGSLDNYGMVFAKGLNGNEWNNRRFTPSDAHGGAADYTYGPMLTIEWSTAVPEPAGLSLFGLGLMVLRKKRS